MLDIRCPSRHGRLTEFGGSVSASWWMGSPELLKMNYSAADQGTNGTSLQRHRSQALRSVGKPGTRGDVPVDLTVMLMIEFADKPILSSITTCNSLDIHRHQN